jgi:hemerythrin superfamily protein
MMENVNTSIEELVGKALDELPRREARRMKRIMRWSSDEKKQEIYDDLLMSMSYDEKFSEQFPVLATGFADDTLGPKTRININPDNLRKWIDLILEYLPAILKLFL